MAEISKAGIPGKNTVGALGDIYINTITGDRYKLVYIYTTTSDDDVVVEYDWELIINEISADVATKEYVDEAILNAQLGGEGGTIDLSNYAKKSDIPSVPTKVSELQNDKGYLTEHQDLSNYAKKSDIPSVPTKVSELQNDKKFVASNTVLRIEVVSELPENEEDGVLYIVK